MDIGEKIRALKQSVPPGVKIIVVTKGQSAETIRFAYESGHKVFGENKVQEMLMKYPLLPKDIEWHFIGHLQRNKVREVLPHVFMIHSVDSLKLFVEIEKEAARTGRMVNCLLQFHIASEATKFGLSFPEAKELLESDAFKTSRFVRFFGVMGMASFTRDESRVRNEFNNLRVIFERLKSTYFSNTDTFRELSMGMSGDYQIALEYGSTMIRVGSLIFSN